MKNIANFNRPKIRNLGQMAGWIYKLNQDASEAYADLGAFGSGGQDCAGIVIAHQNKKLEAIFQRIEQETDLTMNEFYDEVRQRAGEKFVYFYL